MSHHAGPVVVRKSRTTIFDLNEDCWIELIKCLNVKDQLRLASSNLYIGEIFERYACRRYKRIDDSITKDIDDEELKQLLQIVGEHLVRYESDFKCSLSSDQQLGLLRSHCPNLEHLRMYFKEPRSGWDNLYSLTKLKSLTADMDEDMGEECCLDFVTNLKQFTCLRRLKLVTPLDYSGNELYALDQLESLEVDCYDNFDDKNLEDCFQTMKKLRDLKFDCFKNISNNTVEILVKNCQQLERLAFRGTCIDSRALELLCQLPRLKHLQLPRISVSDSLIEGLINKQGAPLESFTLYAGITKVQLKHICDILISSLKELRVSFDTLPLEDLLKLQNLQYLHIQMPITTDQILILLKGLPHLKFLNVMFPKKIHIDSASLVNSVRTWVSKQSEKRGKIKIVLTSNFNTLSSILYANPKVEIGTTCWYNIKPILINEELGERDQN